ncbi:MAG: Helix-turn-helix domain [Gaiellales bacterium]|nr:Helix-turn-helix domain [Gaiellales bacterium]
MDKICGDLHTRQSADAPAAGAVDEEIAWSARLGEHLSAFRERAGMRRRDLAGELGVSDETIRLWEKGSVQPSAQLLSRLIALLSLETADWRREPTEVPDLPPLARRLRLERDGRGMTQAEVVLLLEVPQATYAGWETGRSTPAPLLYRIVGEFLGIGERDVATLCASPFVVNTAGWPPFGQFVGARRQELRLRRSTVAELLNVTRKTIAAWELGYRVPSARLLQRLADVLGVDITALVAALPRRRADTTLGELILSRQRELGLRATDVAERVGTTDTMVSRWIHGHNRPAPASLARLAAALEVPLDVMMEAAGHAA